MLMPVSLEAGQTPAQAPMFIWDRGCVAPGFVAAQSSGRSRGDPGVNLTSDMERIVLTKCVVGCYRHYYERNVLVLSLKSNILI